MHKLKDWESQLCYSNYLSFYNSLEKQRLELERLEAEKERIALERERQERERDRIIAQEREQRRLEQQRLVIRLTFTDDVIANLTTHEFTLST